MISSLCVCLHYAHVCTIDSGRFCITCTSYVLLFVEALSRPTLEMRREETWQSMSESARLACGRAYHEQLYANFDESRNKCSRDLTPVIRALKSALLSKRPLQKNPVGLGSSTMLTVFPLLPVWLTDRLLRAAGVQNSQPAALNASQ